MGYRKIKHGNLVYYFKEEHKTAAENKFNLFYICDIIIDPVNNRVLKSRETLEDIIDKKLGFIK